MATRKEAFCGLWRFGVHKANFVHCFLKIDSNDVTLPTVLPTKAAKFLLRTIGGHLSAGQCANRSFFENNCQLNLDYYNVRN